MIEIAAFLGHIDSKPFVSFFCIIFGKYDDDLFSVCQLGNIQRTQVSFYKDIVRALAMMGEEPLKEDNVINNVMSLLWP